MIDNTSSKPPEDSAPKASGKLLAFSRSKSSESARMSPSSESLGSEESPFALPPIAQPGSPEAPLGLPPAAEPGSAEAPLGLPPNPSQLELLREDRSSLCLMLATPVASLEHRRARRSRRPPAQGRVSLQRHLPSRPQLFPPTCKQAPPTN